MGTGTAPGPCGVRAGTQPRRLHFPAAVLALLVLAGCAPDGNAAAAKAQEFHQDIAAADWSNACLLLQAETRKKAAEQDGSCEDHLQNLQQQEAGAVAGTEKYGRNAVVEFENDTVFLAAGEDGWHITGAGCTPNGDAPYTCQVGGD